MMMMLIDRLVPSFVEGTTVISWQEVFDALCFFLPRCLQQLEPFMSQDNGQIEETICFQMTRINNWNRKFRCACNNNSTGSTHTHEALRRPQGPLKTKRNFTMIKKTFVYFEVAAVLHLGSTRLSEIICQSDGIQFCQVYQQLRLNQGKSGKIIKQAYLNTEVYTVQSPSKLVRRCNLHVVLLLKTRRKLWRTPYAHRVASNLQGLDC